MQVVPSTLIFALLAKHYVTLVPSTSAEQSGARRSFGLLLLRHLKRPPAERDATGWAAWVADVQTLGTVGAALVDALGDELGAMVSVEAFLALLDGLAKAVADDGVSTLKGRNANAVLLLQLRDIVLRCAQLELFEACALYEALAGYLKGGGAGHGATTTTSSYGKFVAATLERDADEARRWFSAFSESPDVHLTFAERALHMGGVALWMGHDVAARQHIKEAKHVAAESGQLAVPFFCARARALSLTFCSDCRARQPPARPACWPPRARAPCAGAQRV